MRAGRAFTITTLGVAFLLARCSSENARSEGGPGCDGDCSGDGGKLVGLDDSGNRDDSSAPDAAALLAECFARPDTSCEFCCGKYFWDEEDRFQALVQPCVCGPGGPCVAVCTDNGFCADPMSGPSSECQLCLVAQLEPGAACSAPVATCAADSACSPYLSCFDSCAAARAG